MASETSKPKIMDVQNSAHGNMIVWTLHSTFGVEISRAVKQFSFMNEAKVEEIETMLTRTFHDYIDIKNLYEEELIKSHVYK